MPAREWAVHGLVCALITARLFTERLGVLPRWFNAADLFGVPLLVVPALLWIVQRQHGRVQGRTPLVLTGLVCVAWGLAWIVNISEVHWIGGLMFIVGLTWPIVFYLALTNLGLRESFARRSLLLLEVLFAINLILGTAQAVTGLQNSDLGADFVFGTFGVNQNQLAFFLAVMIAYRVAQMHFGRLGVYQAGTLVLALVLFLLCGFQTLWVVLLASIGMVHLLNLRLTRRVLAGAALMIAVLAVAMPMMMQTGRFFAVGAILREAVGRFDQLGKVELARNVPEVWKLRPWSPLTGVGPGTFNSRAFRTIAVVPYALVGGQTEVAAAIVEPFYVSDLSSRFIVPYFERGVFYLSGANTDGPFTSYVSVPVEIGLPGAFCLFAIYGVMAVALMRTLKAASEPRQLVLAAWALTNLVMLLGIAFVDNYLETTRYTLPVWLSVAIWKLSSPNGQPDSNQR